MYNSTVHTQFRDSVGITSHNPHPGVRPLSIHVLVRTEAEE